MWLSIFIIQFIINTKDSLVNILFSRVIVLIHKKSCNTSHYLHRKMYIHHRYNVFIAHIMNLLLFI